MFLTTQYSSPLAGLHVFIHTSAFKYQNYFGTFIVLFTIWLYQFIYERVSYSSNQSCIHSCCSYGGHLSRTYRRDLHKQTVHIGPLGSRRFMFVSHVVMLESRKLNADDENHNWNEYI